MDRRSYLLPTKGGTASVAEILASIDREFGRIGLEALATLVAVEVSRRIDLHRAGVESRDPTECPLRQVLDEMRPEFAERIRARCFATFETDGIVLTFSTTNDASSHVMATMQATEIATPASAGGVVPLLYQFPRGRVLAPKWTSVRKRIPDMARRVAAVEERSGISGGGRIEEVLHPEIGKDEMAAYGPVGGSWLEPAPLPDPGLPRQGFVRHADFVRTFDNRIYVAIMRVGLRPKDRVFVHLSDRDVILIQGSKQFGMLVEVPNRIFDLLKSRETVTVVEMSDEPGRPRIAARHVAMVQDVSSSGTMGRAPDLKAWKSRVMARTETTHAAE